MLGFQSLVIGMRTFQTSYRGSIGGQVWCQQPRQFQLQQRIFKLLRLKSSQSYFGRARWSVLRGCASARCALLCEIRFWASLLGTWIVRGHFEQIRVFKASVRSAYFSMG
eukprot:EC094598.1.p2 GENE.EC094598.1~~EC094598.1.p2  ORF type:complete len:110 (+),score=2.01 EC094598.1:111-440(+)